MTLIAIVCAIVLLLLPAYLLGLWEHILPRLRPEPPSRPPAAAAALRSASGKRPFRDYSGSVEKRAVRPGQSGRDRPSAG